MNFWPPPTVTVSWINRRMGISLLLEVGVVSRHFVSLPYLYIAIARDLAARTSWSSIAVDIRVSINITSARIKSKPELPTKRDWNPLTGIVHQAVKTFSVHYA